MSRRRVTRYDVFARVTNIYIIQSHTYLHVVNRAYADAIINRGVTEIFHVQPDNLITYSGGVALVYHSRERPYHYRNYRLLII